MQLWQSGSRQSFHRTVIATAITLAFAGGSGLAIAQDTRPATDTFEDPSVQTDTRGAGGGSDEQVAASTSGGTTEDDATVGTTSDGQVDDRAATGSSEAGASGEAGGKATAGASEGTTDEHAETKMDGQTETTADSETETTATGSGQAGAAGTGVGGQSGEQDAVALLGKPVMNQKGEQVGQVDRVVEDQQGQKSLVITGSQWLGMGERQVVAPMDQITVEQHAVLPQADDLASLQEFNEQQYETVAMAEGEQDQQSKQGQGDQQSGGTGNQPAEPQEQPTG